MKSILVITAIFIAPSALGSTLNEHPFRVGFVSSSTYANADALSTEIVFQDSWIQALLTLPKWESSFAWSAGAAYQETVAGTLAKGLHIGPMAGLGKDSGGNFIYIGVAIGIHYQVDPSIVVSFDGGPTLNSYRGGEVVNFQMKPFGSLLGLGVHFIF
jgi:hypothetical protein